MCHPNASNLPFRASLFSLWSRFLTGIKYPWSIGFNGAIVTYKSWSSSTSKVLLNFLYLINVCRFIFQCLFQVAMKEESTNLKFLSESVLAKGARLTTIKTEWLYLYMELLIEITTLQKNHLCLQGPGDTVATRPSQVLASVLRPTMTAITNLILFMDNYF